MQDFRKLKVWQRSRVVVAGVYRITELFPPSERFGLVSQSRRASVSIAANIAEGCGRSGVENSADSSTSPWVRLLSWNLISRRGVLGDDDGRRR